MLSLGPGRTPYSHASLLAYTAHVPRKPVSIWAQVHPRSIPLNVTWCRSPTTKSKIWLQRDCQIPLSDADKHICPSGPQSQGQDPRGKEGVHFSTFSMHHRVSLAGPLLPRPWTLKTSRPRTVPRGFPVSHSPEVPWGMQLSRLPCSFPHRLSGQRVTHIHPPVLSSLFCTTRKHAGSAWRHAILTPCRS